jgi:hypothetical protein
MRSAFCELHGLHYDRSQSGCALCKKEKSRNLIFLIILTAGLLLVVSFFTVPYFKQSTPDSETHTVRAERQNVGEMGPSGIVESARQLIASVSGNTTGITKIAPEPYQGQIKQLESLIYRESPPDFGDINRIGRPCGWFGS